MTKIQRYAQLFEHMVCVYTLNKNNESGKHLTVSKEEYEMIRWVVDVFAQAENETK